MALTRLGLKDVPVDIPLPWPVFGKTGMLLLPKGGVIPSQDAAALVEGGLYRRRYDGREPQHGSEEKIVIPGLAHPVENIQLRLMEDSYGEKITIPADFLGFIPGVSLIVSHPQRAGHLMRLVVGQRVVVQMLVRKHVHAFQSAVMCMYKHPVHHLHLSYPEGVESSKVRNAPRIDVTVLAMVGYGDEAPVPASINNLSSYGMGLASEYPLGDPGDSIVLSFTLPLVDRPCQVDLRGTIRNVSQLKSQKTYRYGVDLSGLKDDQRMVIEAFIYEHM